MNNRLTAILLAVIIAGGFALRLSGIGFGLPSENRALTTYNPDEALTFYTLEAMNPKKLDFNPRRAFLWGGFSIYLTGAALKTAQAAGIVHPSSRQYLTDNLREADKLYIAARLIPVIFGAAGIFFIFLLVKKAFGDVEGLCAAALLAVLPAHVINSFYVRPDVIMLSFALLGMYLALEKKYFLSGLFIGLAAATKLNAAVFAVFPLLLFFTEKTFKKSWIFLAACFAGFIIGCPYSVIDFKGFYTFISQNLTLAKGTMNPGQAALYGPGIKSYLTYYMPCAAGIPLLIAGLAGFVLSFFDGARGRVFAVSAVIVYLAASATANQVVWYTVPVLPFIVIFAARLFVKTAQLFENKPAVRAAVYSLAVLIFGYTLVYSAATLSLYTGMNTRVDASEWIEKNIPAGSKIAIARSYFWTPPVLRQYNPPYKLIMGGDIQSIPDVYIPGLRGAAKKAGYVVLSEFEYRDYTHPKLRSIFPEQNKVFDEIMNGTAFKEAASFKREAKFFGLVFKQDFPPGDWLIPNPRIVIYERIALQQRTLHPASAGKRDRAPSVSVPR